MVLAATLLVTAAFLLVTLLFGRVWCGWAARRRSSATSRLGRARPSRVTGAKARGAAPARALALVRRGRARLRGRRRRTSSGTSSPRRSSSPPRRGAARRRCSPAPGRSWSRSSSSTSPSCARRFCATACPYAKLQGVLFDRSTLVVAYDARRDADCVDCGACVRVCPTGIDIRDGLQTECIACARVRRRLRADDGEAAAGARPRRLLPRRARAARPGRSAPASSRSAPPRLASAALLVAVVVTRALLDLSAVPDLGLRRAPDAGRAGRERLLGRAREPRPRPRHRRARAPRARRRGRRCARTRSRSGRGERRQVRLVAVRARPPARADRGGALRGGAARGRGGRAPHPGRPAPSPSPEVAMSAWMKLALGARGRHGGRRHRRDGRGRGEGPRGDGGRAAVRGGAAPRRGPASRAALGLAVAVEDEAPEVGAAPLAFRLADREGEAGRGRAGRRSSSRARTRAGARCAREAREARAGPRTRPRSRSPRRGRGTSASTWSAGRTASGSSGGSSRRPPAISARAAARGSCRTAERCALELRPRPLRTMAELAVSVAPAAAAARRRTRRRWRSRSRCPGWRWARTGCASSAAAPGVYAGRAVLVRCPSGRARLDRRGRRSTRRGRRARRVRFPLTVAE